MDDVKAMSIEEFNKIAPRSAARSQERIVLETMEINEALIFENHQCSEKTRRCVVNSAVALMNRKSIADGTNKRYSNRHLPGGKVAVACFEREVN